MKKRWMMILISISLISMLLTIFLVNRPKQIDNELLFSKIADGDLGSVSTLVKKGQDVNVMNNEGFTAFQSAVVQLQPDIASLLLEEGADLSSGDGWLTAEAMIDPSLDANDINISMRDLLHVMYEKNAELVHEVNDQNETLLFEALRIQDSELFHWLITQEVDPEAINSSGDTLYHTAAAFPFESVSFVADTIRYSGSKVNGNGDTPLMIAVKSNHPEWIRELAKTDDINWQNENQWTPLMFAVDYGFIEATEILIELGADLQIKNSDGETAVDIAEKYDNKEVTSLLRQ